MPELPLVSVLITSYNRELYIAEAIESVLSSTYKNFELIIVDDCSTDSTVKIAKHFEKQDERVKVYINEKNIGQFPNRNKAASLARGKYIKYVDSDDLILNSTIEKMVEGMEKYPQSGIGIIFSDPLKISPDKKFPLKVDSNDALIWHYENGGLLHHGPTGSIFKRDLFNTINGFNYEFGEQGDVFLNLKLASISSTILFPENLIFWRQHPGQLFMQENDYFKLLNERYSLNRIFLEEMEYSLPKKIKGRILLSIKIIFLRNALKLLLKGKVSNFFLMLYKQDIQLYQLPMAFIPIRLLGRKTKEFI